MGNHRLRMTLAAASTIRNLRLRDGTAFRPFDPHVA
jgi:hypothetical protein